MNNQPEICDNCIYLQDCYDEDEDYKGNTCKKFTPKNSPETKPFEDGNNIVLKDAVGKEDKTRDNNNQQMGAENQPLIGKYTGSNPRIQPADKEPSDEPRASERNDAVSRIDEGFSATEELVGDWMKPTPKENFENEEICENCGKTKKEHYIGGKGEKRKDILWCGQNKSSDSSNTRFTTKTPSLQSPETKSQDKTDVRIALAKSVKSKPDRNIKEDKTRDVEPEQVGLCSRESHSSGSDAQKKILKEIKEKFNGSVRNYLLSKGQFKDVEIEETSPEEDLK